MEGQCCDPTGETIVVLFQFSNSSWKSAILFPPSSFFLKSGFYLDLKTGSRELEQGLWLTAAPPFLHSLPLSSVTVGSFHSRALALHQFILVF